METVFKIDGPGIRKPYQLKKQYFDYLFAKDHNY